jgi:uncharacterized protein YqeY
MRTRISDAMKAAMKAGDKDRLGTVRLMLAAIKDRELGIGPGATPLPAGQDKLPDADVIAVLQRMVKQRRDSIATYETGGRADLAAKETAEIAVIEEFLPQQMDDAAAKSAIGALITELGAAGPKDMGKVMGELKKRFGGQMDFGKASGLVKELLK